LRAWERDQTADLAPTMAALDAALRRAERAAAWLASLPFTGSAPKAPVSEEPSPKGNDEESGEKENTPPA
jgi:ubiquinone biosynthesis protein COQ9